MDRICPIHCVKCELLRVGVLWNEQAFVEINALCAALLHKTFKQHVRCFACWNLNSSRVGWSIEGYHGLLRP